MQLLDGIGAIPSLYVGASKYQATPDNYQDSVSEPTALSEAWELSAPTSDISMLIPKTEPTPRFQPMSNYPLYSSLVFRHSQAPISIVIECHT